MPAFTLRETHHQVFTPNQDETERMDAAIQCISAIQALDICNIVKRRMLVHAIWEISRASKECDSIYRSAGVIEGELGIQIQRDHIWRRAPIVDALLNGVKIDDLLNRIKICIVTIAEHETLTHNDRNNQNLDGFARYASAQIVIYRCDERDADGHFPSVPQ